MASWQQAGAGGLQAGGSGGNWGLGVEGAACCRAGGRCGRVRREEGGVLLRPGGPRRRGESAVPWVRSGVPCGVGGNSCGARSESFGPCVGGRREALEGRAGSSGQADSLGGLGRWRGQRAGEGKARARCGPWDHKEGAVWVCVVGGRRAAAFWKVRHGVLGSGPRQPCGQPEAGGRPHRMGQGSGVVLLPLTWGKCCLSENPPVPGEL